MPKLKINDLENNGPFTNTKTARSTSV